MKWTDERYLACSENKQRLTECPTNNVLWLKENQFWLPRLHVSNATNMVPIQVDLLAKLKLWVFQDGFLQHQERPATAGNRDLKYDYGDGTFSLSTTSTATVRCEMDFGLYPFDTQKCLFEIVARKNLTYQGETTPLHENGQNDY